MICFLVMWDDFWVLIHLLINFLIFGKLPELSDDGSFWQYKARYEVASIGCDRNQMNW